MQKFLVVIDIRFLDSDAQECNCGLCRVWPCLFAWKQQFCNAVMEELSRALIKLFGLVIHHEQMVAGKSRGFSVHVTQWFIQHVLCSVYHHNLHFPLVIAVLWCPHSQTHTHALCPM
jgi:hypothetical protein